MESKIFNFFDALLFGMVFFALMVLSIVAFTESAIYYLEDQPRDCLMGLGLGVVMTAVNFVMAWLWFKKED